MAGRCESTFSYTTATENYVKTNAEYPSRTVAGTKAIKAEEGLKSTLLRIWKGLQQISSSSTQYNLLQHFAPRVSDILTHLFLTLLCVPLKTNDKNEKQWSLYIVVIDRSAVEKKSARATGEPAL